MRKPVFSPARNIFCTQHVWHVTLFARNIFLLRSLQVLVACMCSEQLIVSQIGADDFCFAVYSAYIIRPIAVVQNPNCMLHRISQFTVRIA